MAGTLRTTTTTLLLERLRDPKDALVWEEFDARYRRILVGVGVKLGLDEEAASEAAQETLVQFVRDYREGRYDRGKGRLRAWIIGICRHRVADAHRRRARERGRRGESAMVDLADEQTVCAAWEEEQRRVVFARAMEVLRESTRTSVRTIRAFEMLAMGNVPAAEVAVELGLETAEVYRIKHRMTERLREIVAELTASYETDG